MSPGVLRTVALLGLLFAGPPGLAADTPPLDLTPYKGQVVLLDFWASWCGPCAQSFPWMTRMQETHADRGLVVIAVNLDAERAAADAFLLDHPGPYQRVFDPEGRVAEAYGVATMPTSIVIDRQGRPVFRHAGFHPEQTAEYERNLLAALDDKAGDQALELTAGNTGGRVKPWQRDVLALRGMQFGADALDLAFDDHIYFSKEASSGGRGFGGGGCGCN